MSLMTPRPSEGQTRGLTYGSVHHDAAAEINASWDAGNIAMAAVILACVLGMYFYFTFWLN